VMTGSDPQPSAETLRGGAAGDITTLPLPLTGEPSPAAQVVLLCGRRLLSPDEARRLRELAETLDIAAWRTVQHLAHVHGLAPLVFTHVAAVGLLPLAHAPVAAALADAYRQTLVTNKHLWKAFVQAVDELAAHGVAVIALKGVALAARYYGDLALRPAGDIDLLVRRADLRLAGQALQRLGYRADHGQARAVDFSALVFAELSFTRQDKTHIELHWELTHAPGYRQALPVAGAWLRSQEHTLDGQRVRCLRADDELRFLCTHCAADHGLDRLLWLVDIAELVRSLPAGWDWAAFLRETVSVRLAAPVAAALTACRAQLGLQLPPDVVPTLRAAATTPAEQAAWRAAHAALFSQEGLRAQLGALRSVADAAVFLRGVLAPGPTKVRQTYGSTTSRGARLPLAYVRHWGRMARQLSALLTEPGGALGCVRLPRDKWPVRPRGNQRPRD
jgi:hypothetical protein